MFFSLVNPPGVSLVIFIMYAQQFKSRPNDAQFISTHPSDNEGSSYSLHKQTNNKGSATRFWPF